MKISIAAAAVGLASLAPLGCGTPEQESLGDGSERRDRGAAQPPERARLEAVWSRAREEGVSAVALVRHRGRVLAQFEAGESRRDEGQPNRADTAFDIGSLTKQFTGAAISLLHERGQLSLDAPLGSFFEGVPPDKAGITVHQLLTHTAGLPSALGDDEEPILREEYLARAWQWPLSAEPGSLHWYSNTGYSILGAIIERITGRPYEEYLVDEVLRPAGVDETGYLGLELGPSRVAVGYLEDDADDPLERAHAPDGYYWNLRANGGLLSTAPDLARWSDALLGGNLLGGNLLGGNVLGKEALAQYLTPHVREGLGRESSYAYGWVVADTAAGKLLWHDGGNGYFFATVRQYLDADLLVIVLANEDTDAAVRLPAELSHAVLPELADSEAEDGGLEPVFEHEEALSDTTQSYSESVDFIEGEDRAVAGFFAELESGSVHYRVRAPDGEVFAEGDAQPGMPLELLLVIPARLGRWQLEMHPSAATGALYFAWTWD